MDFTETEVTEVRFDGMVNEHIACEIIWTQSINFFCIVKNNKKRKEKKKLKISPPPESIMVHLHSSHGQYHCAMSTLDNEREENKPANYIHYKTADNSAGSSLSVG